MEINCRSNPNFDEYFSNDTSYILILFYLFHEMNYLFSEMNI